VEKPKAWLVALLAVLIVFAVIWLSVWLGDRPRRAFAPAMRIGGSMLVAGCIGH
jgi:hypothetical protein